MVNYQGPEAIRGFVEAMNIPIFNRVCQINYRFRDLSKIQLAREDIARVHQLQQISVEKHGRTLLNESEVKAIKDIAPPCRLSSVEMSSRQIKVNINPGSAFACCAE